MEEMTKKEQFSKWLKGQDPAVARLLALRIAARVEPFIARPIISDNFRTTWRSRLTIGTFRCILAAKLVNIERTESRRGGGADAYAAYADAADAGAYAAADAGAYAAYAAAAAATAAADDADAYFYADADAADAAADAAYSGADAAFRAGTADVAIRAGTAYAGADVAAYVGAGGAAANGVVWGPLNADIEFLATGDVRRLLERPLWLDKMHPEVASHWRDLQNFLLKDDPNWQFWIDTYNHILTGIKPDQRPRSPMGQHCATS